MPNLPQAGKSLSIATFDRSLSPARGACDLTSLKFIDAYGLVGTACSLRAANARAIVPPAASKVRTHLSVMGFRGFLGAMGVAANLPDVPASEHPDVVVPLREATSTDGAQALSNLLWEQLAEHVAPQVLSAIAEGVWEMVANALEHSGSDALIMGQVYRAPRGEPPDHDDRVQVVIGDTGRGIRESFLEAGRHAPATDLAAITLALEYLVSSVDDPGRGQGLSTTMEQVLDTQGRMVVRSGTARITLESSRSTAEVVPFLPGVIVALSLPLYPG